MVNEMVISKLLPISHRLIVAALREAPDGPLVPPPPCLAAPGALVLSLKARPFALHRT